MITFEVFLIGLMVISTVTSLVTEGVKKILDGYKKTYNSNALVAIVATVLSAVVGVCYVIFTGTTFTAQVIICIIALVFASWLCAMVGYDKVVAVIKKLKGAGK